MQLWGNTQSTLREHTDSTCELYLRPQDAIFRLKLRIQDYIFVLRIFLLAQRRPSPPGPPGTTSIGGSVGLEAFKWQPAPSITNWAAHFLSLNSNLLFPIVCSFRVHWLGSFWQRCVLLKKNKLQKFFERKDHQDHQEDSPAQREAEINN